MKRRDADFSGFLGETFAILRDAAPWVAGYVLALTVLNSIPALAFGVTQSEYAVSWGFRIDSNIINHGVIAVLAMLAIGIVVFVLQYLFFAHILAHRGFSNGRNRFLGFLGFSILSGLGIALGFLLLVIPGIILLVRWIAASAFIVGTDTKIMDAFGRSWDLTRGKGWPIFFAAVVLGISITVVFGVIAIPATALLGSTSAGATVVEVLGQNLYSAIFVAFSTGVFYLLNDNTEAVSEVFE
ncbi:hypothetical protein [Parerythrobacter jejuensis]|uniref:DUF7847 domain-containing protein n=1 Tax=Parerythrobacter jejuensis TaxID=795812 RepID=A0A845AMT4_9SPHN|nr:hypothetical protein [Parerythrobacter jejuensis]MXP32112.1 hypothetical protein [Parerythrobacter jejuensis]